VLGAWRVATGWASLDQKGTKSRDPDAETFFFVLREKCQAHALAETGKSAKFSSFEFSFSFNVRGLVVQLLAVAEGRCDAMGGWLSEGRGNNLLNHKVFIGI